MNKSKLLITQQEMVLIKNSEETKKTEIYGNLFDCIAFYKKLSIQEMDNDATFDERARVVLMSVDNKKMMMEKIMNEWYSSKDFEETDRDVFCQLCNTKNKYIFYIKNKLTDIELHIGSECVKKFPDIIGVKQETRKLSQLKKELERQKRIIDFDSCLKEDIDFLKNSEQVFENYPVLLTKKLYRGIEETLRQMNGLRTSYISSGGNIEEVITKYYQLKEIVTQLFVKAEARTNQVASSILVCDRETSDWLKKHNMIIWNEVLENDGLFNQGILSRMQSAKYVEKQLSVFRQKISDRDIVLQRVSGDSIIFYIKNKRYSSGVSFSMKIREFMKDIGCRCLTDSKYTYGKADIKEITIEPSKHNIDTVMNSINSVLLKKGYDIREEKSGDIYWVQKEHRKKANMWSSSERVIQGVMYKRLRNGDLTKAYSQFLLLDEVIFVNNFDVFKRGIEAGKTWITESEKKRNEEIAREAGGLQKQREFIPY